MVQVGDKDQELARVAVSVGKMVVMEFVSKILAIAFMKTMGNKKKIKKTTKAKKTKPRKKLKKKRKPQTRALVLSQLAVSPRQNIILTTPTPPEYIKTRKGKGNRMFTYIEGGYVIAKLNEAFSPVGWDFEIVAQGQSDRKPDDKADGEVWVRGKLTIKDHKNGYEVSKTQYGQHTLYKGNMIGDAYKAASTDALKKCASMLGIGLDVYWQQLDNEQYVIEAPAPKKVLSTEEMITTAKKIIDGYTNKQQVNRAARMVNESKKYNKEQKNEMVEYLLLKLEKLAA